MAENTSSGDEKRLSGSLKLEADTTRPAFSEALHARTMQAIHDSRARASNRRSGRREPAWLIAAVGVLLVAAASIALRFLVGSVDPTGTLPEGTALVEPSIKPSVAPKNDPEPDGNRGTTGNDTTPNNDPLLRDDTATQVVANEATEIEAINEMPEQIGTVVELALADRKWAYLDQDARLAAGMLLDYLPLDMLASTEEP